MEVFGQILELDDDDGSFLSMMVKEYFDQVEATFDKMDRAMYGFILRVATLHSDLRGQANQGLEANITARALSQGLVSCARCEAGVRNVRTDPELRQGNIFRKDPRGSDVATKTCQSGIRCGKETSTGVPGASSDRTIALCILKLLGTIPESPDCCMILAVLYFQVTVIHPSFPYSLSTHAVLIPVPIRTSSSRRSALHFHII